MIIKNAQITKEELKTLRDAQRIVEDMRMDNLFGDKTNSYMLLSVSGGLSVIINEKLQEMRGD
jgi:hypothetical protein